MMLYSSILLTVSVFIKCSEGAENQDAVVLDGEAWPSDVPSPFRDFWRYFDRRPKATLPEEKPAKTLMKTELKEQCGYTMYALSYPKPPELDGHLMGFKLDNILLDIFFSKQRIQDLKFIHKIIPYTCDRVEIEYLVKGEIVNEQGQKVYSERCEATTYAREKMYVMLPKPPILLERYQWVVKTKAEDCEDWSKETFLNVFKDSVDDYLPFGGIELNTKNEIEQKTDAQGTGTRETVAQKTVTVKHETVTQGTGLPSSPLPIGSQPPPGV